MKSKDMTRPAAHQDRFRRAYDDRYAQKSRKLPGGTRCPDCGAVRIGGRWRRPTTLPGARWRRCAACVRVRAGRPAGELRLEGAFIGAHLQEIINLIRNEAAREVAEHPLNRLMDVNVRSDVIVVTTTDIHLPRRLGHALERAYQGELRTDYLPGEQFVRIGWHRD